jgi:hypothetical protein
MFLFPWQEVPGALAGFSHHAWAHLPKGQEFNPVMTKLF